MKTFIIKRKETLFKRGYGNGYVVIPKGFPLHGLHYDDFYIEVHGGLTFSSPASRLIDLEYIDPVEDKDSWVFGFDTAHLYSHKLFKDRKSVQEELNRLVDRILNLDFKLSVNVDGIKL